MCSVTIDHFTFYRSYFEAINDMGEKDQLLLFRAICKKALNGEDSDLDGISKTLFRLIEPNIESNRKNIENGSRGGRPKAKKPIA